MKKISLLALALAIVMLFTACGQAATSETANEPKEEVAAVAETAETVEETEEVYQAYPVNNSPLSDVRVRQAIAYAIDMNTIAETFFNGKVTPAASLVTGSETDLRGYEYNPEKAIELLKEAGWDESYVLKVLYTYTDQQTVDFMAVVQQYLAAVGIQMEASLAEGDLNTILWSVPEDKVNGPSAVDYDIYYGAIGTYSRYGFYSAYTGATSTTPYCEELANIVTPVLLTNNADEQDKYFHDIEEFFADNMVLIPLYHMDVYSIQSDRVNRNGSSLGNEQYAYDWKIETWDVEADSTGKKVLHTNNAPAEFFWDPISTANGNIADRLLFDHLVVADGDIANFAGQQASEYVISDDGLSVTFTLRDDLKWHDGTAITPEDVKFTWEFAKTVTTLQGSFKDTVNKISEIAVDGNNITFVFSEVSPTMMYAFSQLPTLPKAYIEDADPTAFQQDSFWQSPVGSGPFKIKEVSMNNYTVMEAFEEYHEGRPVIDEVYMYPSAETDANLVKNVSAGVYDYAWSKSVADAETVETIDGYTVNSYPMLYTRVMYLNKYAR